MRYEYVDDYKLKSQPLSKDYGEYWLVKESIDGHIQILRRGQLEFLAYDYYHNDHHKNPLFKIIKVGIHVEHTCNEDEIRAALKELNENW